MSTETRYGPAPTHAPVGKRGWWCRVPDCGAWGLVEPGQAAQAANDHVNRSHTSTKPTGRYGDKATRA